MIEEDAMSLSTGPVSVLPRMGNGGNVDVLSYNFSWLSGEQLGGIRVSTEGVHERGSIRNINSTVTRDTLIAVNLCNSCNDK